MERRISLIDLMSNEDCKKKLLAVELRQATPASLKPMFFELGFDVNNEHEMGVQLDSCWHRPHSSKDNKAIKGIMFYSRERADSEWLRSEHCSFENKCEQIEDQSLRQELVNMSREINYHEATVNYMSVGKGNKKK